MYTALIVDDEHDARGVMRKLLEMFCPEVTYIAEAKDAIEAMQLATSEHFDLAFLDIELKHDSGLELAEQLVLYCPNIIFVTAYDHFAVEAFQTKAIHYLLKPVDPKFLRQAIDRAAHSGRPVIKLNIRDGQVILEQSTIIRLKGEGNYTTFFTEDGQHYLVSRNLAHYEDLLDPRLFFRIHQSHLVALAKVRELRTSTVVLNDGNELPIARRRKDDFKKALGK
ncbi:MAG: LytTR family DNA-binding domain-containing protein [Bacteroidota bacterium]